MYYLIIKSLDGTFVLETADKGHAAREATRALSDYKRDPDYYAMPVVIKGQKMVIEPIEIIKSVKLIEK